MISNCPQFGNELNESATKTTMALEKSHSMTQAGDTLKKVATLTKRNATIAAGHLVNVFTVVVSRKLGKAEILSRRKL